MTHLLAHRLLPVALLAVCGAAPAQPAPPPERPDPLSASAAVPPAIYASPLARYRRHADEKIAPWKEANDQVGRIGGWRSYAREAQQAEPVQPPASAAAPGAVTGVSPPPDPHAGHASHPMK